MNLEDTDSSLVSTVHLLSVGEVLIFGSTQRTRHAPVQVIHGSVCTVGLESQFRRRALGWAQSPVTLNVM